MFNTDMLREDWRVHLEPELLLTQVQPGSMRQFDEHPSPFLLLPSSH
jgi:hypothetical protein